MVTLAVGWLVNVKVKVAVPPASVVVPIVGLTNTPAISLSDIFIVAVPALTVRPGLLIMFTVRNSKASIMSSSIVFILMIALLFPRIEFIFIVLLKT